MLLLELTKPEKRLLTQLLNGNWVYVYDHRNGGHGYMYASNLVRVTEQGRALIDKGVCIEKDKRLVIAPAVITRLLNILGGW